MEEADIRRKIIRYLKRIGYLLVPNTNLVVCPHCGKKIFPKTGRPDVIMVHPKDPGVYIEVKWLKQNEAFSFSDLKDQQRSWLWELTWAGGESYLGLGVVHREKGKGDRTLGIYLIPWRAWLRLEDRISTFQDSIPWIAGPGYNKSLQELHLDVYHKLANYKII